MTEEPTTQAKMRNVVITATQTQVFTVPVASRTDQDACDIAREIIGSNEQLTFVDAVIQPDESEAPTADKLVH